MQEIRQERLQSKTRKGKTMKRKKVYQVFNTATDAYLEYVNNFLTKERFAEFFYLDELEVERLFDAAKDVKENNLHWFAIDYYFQKMNNKNYTEKKIHW